VAEAHRVHLGGEAHGQDRHVEAAPPRLVVRGERDYFANPEGAKAWAAAIPGAQLLSLPGLGHLAVLEKPEAVNAPLQEFFAGRWPPGAAAASAK